MNLNTLQGRFSEAKQMQRTVRKGSISCCIYDVCAVSKSTVILVVVQSMSPRDCAENSISTYLGDGLFSWWFHLLCAIPRIGQNAD